MPNFSFFCCCLKDPVETGTPEEQAAKKARKELEKKRKQFEERKNSSDGLRKNGMITESAYNEDQEKLAVREVAFKNEEALVTAMEEQAKIKPSATLDNGMALNKI